MIFPVWQPLFSSSHRLAAQWSEELGEPVTHTGTLDPVAQGVLVLLSGEDRFAKGALSDWEKVYEFSIVWGVQTDTGDQMGLITQLSSTLDSLERLGACLSNFPNAYDQRIPDFSARRWLGGSAFDAAKKQQQLEPKFRRVLVSDMALLKSEVLSIDQLIAAQQAGVSSVSGDFRQQEILSNWKTTVFTENFYVVTHHMVQTSAGTYVRQLVQDIAQKVGVPALTWSITRVKNGPYEKEDTLSAHS